MPFNVTATLKDVFSAAGGSLTHHLASARQPSVHAENATDQLQRLSKPTGDGNADRDADRDANRNADRDADRDVDDETTVDRPPQCASRRLCHELGDNTRAIATCQRSDQSPGDEVPRENHAAGHARYSHTKEEMEIKHYAMNRGHYSSTTDDPDIKPYATAPTRYSHTKEDLEIKEHTAHEGRFSGTKEEMEIKPYAGNRAANALLFASRLAAHAEESADEDTVVANRYTRTHNRHEDKVGTSSRICSQSNPTEPVPPTSLYCSPAFLTNAAWCPRVQSPFANMPNSYKTKPLPI